MLRSSFVHDDENGLHDCSSLCEVFGRHTAGTSCSSLATAVVTSLEIAVLLYRRCAVIDCESAISMRVDEGRKGSSIFAVEMEAHNVAGRGEKSLLRDAGSELRLLNREGGREREVRRLYW